MQHEEDRFQTQRYTAMRHLAARQSRESDEDRRPREDLVRRFARTAANAPKRRPDPGVLKPSTPVERARQVS